MPLIKSHSNYVLKRKHQLTNDGTVFERDITTIGAVNQFAPGQIPIYRSGNFIITVRDDRNSSNQYNTQKWEKCISGDSWTLESIYGMVSGDESQDDTKIVLKNDYYDFRDFAYYGSLTELFRSSMNDILERFPGELYCVPSAQTYYTSAYTIDFEKFEERISFSSEYSYVSNPYMVNIHSVKMPEGANKLKYFANDGYKNYEIFSGDSTTPTSITTWKVTENAGCKNPGELIATITINSYKLYAYLGDNNEVVYLHENGSNDVHIRPKRNPFIIKFYNECNDFEKLILNEDATPKYKATFSVINDNEYGFYREMQDFVFPTSDGGYNPSTDSSYIERLVNIGEYYDENLTDNLYRVMTHEAIKNFDWSYTREYTDGDEEEYYHGGQKIQKALRIFAREFDEIKKYIDNIKNTGKISYDERSNIPDYFLSDICEEDGWDIKSVIPYDLNGITAVTDTSKLLSNEAGKHEYSQNSSKEVFPYDSSFINDGTANGYFVTCESGGTGVSCYLKDWYGDTVSASSLPYTFGFPSDRIVYKIKPYSDSANKYTYMDVNNEFLKRLKLNSRYIWRHKGTLEGIEMILGMFGLKSKRWMERTGRAKYDGTTSNPCSDETCSNVFPDYEIIEYTSFAKRIEDKWDTLHNMYHIDWVNSTKTIVYDNRTVSNYGMTTNYTSYQGLPVAYRDYNGHRYLYPNFDKNDQIDGNIYFQMDGGWLAKTLGSSRTAYQNFQFDVDDNIVHSPVTKGGVNSDGYVVDNHKLYKETVRSIKRVNDIMELLSLPQSDLYDGIICYVGKVGDELAVIDGDVFPIERDNGKRFVRFVRNGGFIKVGGLYFDDGITVLGSNLSAETYSLDDKLDGYEVRAFIKSDDTFVCKSSESEQYAITSFKIVKSDETASNGNSYSNYFKLDDVVFSDSITYTVNGNGWRRLLKTDTDYLKINTIYNYYEGNNGHNGNLKYDSGHEYFTYFQRLFKYAEDNSLFDTRCYGEGFDDLYETLNPSGTPIGFSGLVHPNEDVKDYDSYISADTKVHYFGNYKTRKNNNYIDKIYIYGDDVNTTQWKKFYGTANTISSYTIGGGIDIDGEIQPHTSTDSITNQIVNNKRIKIVFNMRNKFNTKNGQIELKYIDDIVMNYLTQLIPSTVITEIEYDFCGFTNKEC